MSRLLVVFTQLLTVRTRHALSLNYAKYDNLSYFYPFLQHFSTIPVCIKRKKNVYIFVTSLRILLYPTRLIMCFQLLCIKMRCCRLPLLHCTVLIFPIMRVPKTLKISLPCLILEHSRSIKKNIL